MSNKPFSKTLRDIHDPKGKEAGRQLIQDIQSNAVFLEINYGEEQHDFSTGKWDFSFLIHGQVVRFDVECRDSSRWGIFPNPDWPWPFEFRTVHVPGRKGDYCGSDYFIAMSQKFNYSFIVDTKLALPCPTVEVKNGYEEEGGTFFDVPAELGQFFENVNGHWREWCRSASASCHILGQRHQGVLV